MLGWMNGNRNGLILDNAAHVTARKAKSRKSLSGKAQQQECASHNVLRIICKNITAPKTLPR
jgi:hypothetical protein